MITKIDDVISYIEPTLEPLSANAVMIEGKEYIWLYDVGNNPAWIEKLNSFNKKTNIVLSHFHPDHIGNMTQVSYNELYVGKNTYKYTNAGTIVEKEMFIEDGRVKLHILPVPSSHAKGSLALEVNEKYILLGDATYATQKSGKIVFNAEQLLGQIRMLEALKGEYVLLSHDKAFVKGKNIVLDELKQLYSKRTKNEPYIVIGEAVRQE